MGKGGVFAALEVERAYSTALFLVVRKELWMEGGSMWAQ